MLVFSVQLCSARMIESDYGIPARDTCRRADIGVPIPL